MRCFLAWCAGVLLLGTLGAPILFAQSVDTGILGTVVDTSKAVVPGLTFDGESTSGGLSSLAGSVDAANRKMRARMKLACLIIRL